MSVLFKAVTARIRHIEVPHSVFIKSLSKFLFFFFFLRESMQAGAEKSGAHVREAGLSYEVHLVRCSRCMFSSGNFQPIMGQNIGP